MEYNFCVLTFLILILGKQLSCDNSLAVNTHDLDLKLFDNRTVQIVVGSNFSSVDEILNINIQQEQIASTNFSNIALNNILANEKIPLNIEALRPGKTNIYANTTKNLTNVEEVYLRVTVHKKDWLNSFSIAIGWIYFVAWSVSFYPQVWINWKRKCVIGLNFDFLSLNIVGFVVYSAFNLGLYFIPEIKLEYSERYPHGLNPVQLNDIFFSVHAVLLTLITIIQCFVYDSGQQRVSTTAKTILGIFGTVLTVSIFLAIFKVIYWLDFLYHCSYVKLTITILKYIPQAYMNYQRKSTVGWSIFNIFLDFTGGTLSVLQMLFNAYNYDDWESIFGDATKFGLGLFSVAFDVFFIFQHYVFYKEEHFEKKNVLILEK